MNKIKWFCPAAAMGLFLLLAGCATPAAPAPPDCSGETVYIIPTATRLADPDLFSPPAPPESGGGGSGCPSPEGAEASFDEPPEAFVATEVVNLSLDIDNQNLAAAAVGDDMVAAAWLAGEDIFVALSRGGRHFQVRRIDRGQSVSLAFSRANRLHVVYAQDGRIYYRAADQGTHPADVTPIFVAEGTGPQVVVDELSWAHVLYEQDGRIFKNKHLSGNAWLTQFVTHGTNLTVLPFYNERELTLWGIPAGSYWFGLFMAATAEGEVRIFRYLSWFNVWELRGVFPVPAGETLTGPVGLDFQAGPDDTWAVATWVTHRPPPAPPTPPYAPPLFAAANPLAPNGIGNPEYLYDGLNAARWSSLEIPFDAGLFQVIAVSDAGGTITAEGWGRIDGAAEAAMALQIGIDPTGGENPLSPEIVWSEPAAPRAFTPFRVSAPAHGGQATVFLRGTLNSSATPGSAVWDGIAIQNGTLTNGSFEAPFALQDSLTVPAGWTAWVQDAASLDPGGRDVYTVYAAWSDNGGAAWTGPEAIAANRDLSGGTTGAIRPDVAPVISLSTVPPSLTAFYIYEAGDPPPETTFRRFGRPVQTRCELGTATCSDTPGTPLLPREVVRPSERLLAAADPFHEGRAVLVWDALQSDAENKDVFATYVVLR